MKTYSKSKINSVKRGANRATYDVDKINAILDAGFLGYVSYVYQGNAICLPMGYGRKGNKIYLHGSQRNRLLLALLNVGKMSITVTHLDGLVLARSGLHHSVNYRSATLFGSVKKIENDTEKEAALLSFMEQMIAGRWNEIRPMHQHELDRTLVVEMTVETASAKIRDVGVIDEPEDESLSIWAGVIPIRQISEYPISDDKLPKNLAVPKHVINYYEKHKL